MSRPNPVVPGANRVTIAVVALVFLIAIIFGYAGPTSAQDMTAMNTMQQINTQNLINQAAGVYDSPKPAPKPQVPAQQVIVVPEGAKVYYNGQEIRSLPSAGQPKPPRFVQGKVTVFGDEMHYVTDTVAKVSCYRRAGNSSYSNWSCAPHPGAK